MRDHEQVLGAAGNAPSIIQHTDVSRVLFCIVDADKARASRLKRGDASAHQIGGGNCVQVVDGLNEADCCVSTGQLEPLNCAGVPLCIDATMAGSHDRAGGKVNACVVSSETGRPQASVEGSRAASQIKQRPVAGAISDEFGSLSKGAMSVPQQPVLHIPDHSLDGLGEQRANRHGIWNLITAAAVLLVLCGSLRAADVHCGASATGSGNGSDWNNQCDFDTVSPVRGNTYFLADGSYAGKTLSTANSGTTRIIVKKAIAADYGSAAGWSSTFGDGVATFNGGIVLASGYWTIDGQTGGGPGSWETGFGILVNGSFDDNAPNTDSNVDDIILRHVEVDVGSTGAESGAHCVVIDHQQTFLMEYFFCHDIGEDVFKIRYTNSNLTIQYGKVARSYQSAGAHGDLFEVPAGSVTGTFLVRWNYFEDVVGSYLFGVHEFSDVPDYEVYGNILHFKNKGSDTGNGTIGVLSGCSGCSFSIAFCNNTVAGIFSASTLGVNNVSSAITGTIHNNIWYEGTDGSYGFGYGGVTQSHNSHYNMASVAGTGNENPTGNPFTAIASNDLSLTAGSTAGTGSGCPAGNSVDMFGTTRGVDGTLDRGAIEFDSGAGPSSPTVTTTTATSITATTASSGGNVTSDGGDSVTSRGVCRSLSANPTTSDTCTSDGTGTGAFTSSLSGMSSNTLYHIRAFATNGVGTSYGSDLTFTTEAEATVSVRPSGVRASGVRTQ